MLTAIPDNIMILSLLPAALLLTTAHRQAEAADNGPGNFIWLTDAHYDRHYGTPQAKIHKTGAPCNLTSAPTYSAYGCGGSPALVSAAIEAAANATDVLGWEKPDFVIFTGDNARHNALSKEDVLSDIRIVNKLIRDSFPNTQLVELPTLDLGNNDFQSDYYINVTSSKPCLPTLSSDGSIVNYPESTNEWLEAVADQQSDTFADELEKSTFACGGYMLRELNPSLSIIILNTVVWTLNWEKLAPEPVNALDKIDPFGQFAWLENRLSKLRDQGKKVFVTGHVPPMLQSFTGSQGQPLYLTEQQQRIDDIITSYNNVVAALLVAHVHSNELRYNSRYGDDAPPLLVGTSLSPCYTTNPAFRVAKYDSGGSQSPIDIATFQADISKNIPADVSNPFTNIVPSLIEYLGMSSLTNKETLKLANKLLPGSDDQNQTIWNNYFNSWYKGVPQTACETETCQRAEACLVGCGFLEDEWQKCNSSGLASIKDACGYAKGSPSSSQCMMTGTWIIQLCTLIACIITFVFV